jgi:hypothetical protein
MRYFVSGHRDLTEQEFVEHYLPKLLKVIEFDKDPIFLVGNYEGCDEMFLKFMQAGNYDHFVYLYYVDNPMRHYDYVFTRHMETPNDCDYTMTSNSDFDIAWIRPGREDSHTANNIRRRYGLK